MTTDQLFLALGDNFYSLKQTHHGFEALSCFVTEDKPGEDGGRVRTEGKTAQEALTKLLEDLATYYAKENTKA